VASDAEIAVEIDPRGLSDPMIAAMARAGVNRASIGVQDCDAKVQRAINRIQPFQVTKSAVERLRAAGIDKLSIDLIYGLPHQTVALLEGSIARAVALEPDRLAIFGYAHVPHFKKHQNLIEAAALPGVRERLAQFEAAHALLAELGYVPVGLDHFARPHDPMAIAAEERRLARNFQGYTTDTAPALIGLGASAISALPQGYAQNAVDVPAYRTAIEAGGLATARGIALSPDDRLRRAIIERLMCDLDVDVTRLASEHDAANTDFAVEFAALQDLATSGVVVVNGGHIAVPAAARVAVRSVCAVFDRYLAGGGERHALAV
jgi:oxygen-independent coproporphyrinogen-3 oxidase